MSEQTNQRYKDWDQTSQTYRDRGYHAGQMDTMRRTMEIWIDDLAFYVHTTTTDEYTQAAGIELRDILQDAANKIPEIYG